MSIEIKFILIANCSILSGQANNPVTSNGALTNGKLLSWRTQRYHATGDENETEKNVHDSDFAPKSNGVSKYSRDHVNNHQYFGSNGNRSFYKRTPLQDRHIMRNGQRRTFADDSENGSNDEFHDIHENNYNHTQQNHFIR